MKTRWIAACLCAGLLMMVSGYAAPQSRTSAEPPPQSQPTGNDGTAAGQSTDAQGGISVFRSGINYVRVDAFVTDDDGNPVFDLTADDFEVYEDEVLQTVDSFQVVQVDRTPELSGEPLTSVGVTRSDQQLAASRADIRVFVVFLDDYHVRDGNSIRARRMLVDFIENDLISTDLVGVMYPLMPVSDVRLTRDHEAVINAIRRFEGVKYEYDVRNLYESRYNMYPTEIVERVRNEVSLSALRGLMTMLGGLREGRKSVLLVSEGYTNYVPPQMRSQVADLRADPNVNPAVLDPFAGDNPYEETMSFFEGSAMMSDLRRVYETASRFNASIYSVDPRGLAAFEFDLDQPQVSYRTDQRTLRFTQDTLRVLAEETGGRAIVNQNDLRPGLRQMLDDASGYYLLGYNSSAAPTDGEFHEIEVRLKREGLRVRAREGYWAVTVRDVERSLVTRAHEPPKAVDVALSALAEPRRGRLVRTWVGTSRAENGRTRVTFAWEPTQARGRRDTASRVLVTAMGDTGGAYFRGRVPEQNRSSGRGTTRRRSRREAVAPLVATRVEFEADPGTMQMNLAIEGEAGEVLDRDRDEIVIPDFTGPDVVLSTPYFVRARNALELKTLVADWNALPTVSRDFRRTDRLLLRFDVYAPGDAAPDMEANLLNRGGDTMFPLDVVAAEDGGASRQVELAPAFLPSGEYIIEIRATLGDGEASEMVAFRLGA
jgi:VWFA-related protein